MVVTISVAPAATSAGDGAAATRAPGSSTAISRGARGRALGVAAPDVDVRELQDRGVELRLEARLDAGAEDAEHVVGAAELLATMADTAAVRRSVR